MSAVTGSISSPNLSRSDKNEIVNGVHKFVFLTFLAATAFQQLCTPDVAPSESLVSKVKPQPNPMRDNCPLNGEAEENEKNKCDIDTFLDWYRGKNDLKSLELYLFTITHPRHLSHLEKLDPQLAKDVMEAHRDLLTLQWRHCIKRPIDISEYLTKIQIENECTERQSSKSTKKMLKNIEKVFDSTIHLDASYISKYDHPRYRSDLSKALEKVKKSFSSSKTVSAQTAPAPAIPKPAFPKPVHSAHRMKPPKQCKFFKFAYR